MIHCVIVASATSGGIRAGVFGFLIKTRSGIMENLFVDREVIVYKEIVGDPIFDVYDDEGWIQYSDNKLDRCEVNSLGDDVTLEEIGFLLVYGSILELSNSRSNDLGANWALLNIGPIKAFTCNRNEEHMKEKKNEANHRYDSRTNLSNPERMMERDIWIYSNILII
ncbi:hypothetical protein YC2023_026761 [Brassica napus]